MFVIALFGKNKRLGEEWVFREDWGSKLCSIHSMEYNAGISKIEVGQRVLKGKESQDTE